MTCLQNIRLHGKYLRLISNQHQEQLANIIRENRLSSHTHTPIERGLRKSWVLSPSLFQPMHRGDFKTRCKNYRIEYQWINNKHLHMCW